MGLFAQGLDSQPQQRLYAGMTREQGTRRLISWFVAVVCAWVVVGRVQDHFLLKAKWGTLAPQHEGLTVVGTLDSKDYDHNLFRIVTANQTSRVELTEYGWNSIFDEKNGALFAPAVGDTIRAVDGIDSETCDRMLEPYLRAGIDRIMGKPDWNAGVAANTPITVQITSGNVSTPQATTLSALIKKYTQLAEAKSLKDDSEESEGSSGSGRQVDHGFPITADSLVVTAPVVLTDSCFTSADLDENPSSVFDTKSYTARLHLTPEGRSRFFQWSSAHENENLVFILKHRVVVAGRVKQQMDVNSWEIGPLHDQETATALVDYVNKMHK